MALAPIWKDYTVTLGNSSYYTFEIRLNDAAGDLLFTGRVYKRPGAASVVTRINDICAAYLRDRLPALQHGFTSLENSATFAVCVGGTAIDTVTFWNDWSYDPDFNPATMDLADPVTPRLDPRQWLFYSVLPGTADVTALLTFEDGTSFTVIVPVIRTADFNDDFSDDFSVDANSSGGGTAVLDLSTFTGLVSVTIGGTVYRVGKDTCHDYAVYYVNAYGGWDSLLLEGRHDRRDSYVRHTFHPDYDNADITQRGTKDYAIEVMPAWTLRTGLLSDDESSRMHHLLGSTEVYLCDLVTRRFYPVVLTDIENAVQTYKGNGAKPASYTFNAQLAQERYRR